MSIFITALMYLGYVLIFPGFLFCFIVGLLLCGIDRKLVARMQKRVGPRFSSPSMISSSSAAKRRYSPQRHPRRCISQLPL